MGCDIHMYTEYRSKKRAKEREEIGETEYWSSFGDRINPGRDYGIFTILAGVRGQSEHSFSPKGKIPRENMGYSSRSDAFLWITENPSEDGSSCTREQAERYKSYGLKIVDQDWVEHPDWHSHSWMDLEEFEEALNRYEILSREEWGIERGPGIEYLAVLSAMKTLSNSGENEVRIVFWFDN